MLLHCGHKFLYVSRGKTTTDCNPFVRENDTDFAFIWGKIAVNA